MAKQKKTKEPITIRFRELTNGNLSVYLDTYRNGQRSYEFLKMYIIPEVGDNKKQIKNQNEQTMQLVEAIKSQRYLSLINGEAGVKTSNKSKMLLIDWLEIYKKSQIDKGKQDYRQISYCIKLVQMYNGNVTLQQVDKKYCIGFLEFLQYKYENKRDGKQASKFTARNYYRCLNSALNSAVENDIIQVNPFSKVPPKDKIKLPESPRVYLTAEEVKRLAETECTHPIIKQVFLFSVCSGLRIGDIERLTWNDIEQDGNVTRLKIVQHKTKEVLYIPLSEQAKKYMPERGTDTKVFPNICQTYGNKILKDWAKSANIDKRVHWHVARHTFATLQMTLDTDIYTISKLLGHTDVKTTQIYAKVIDKKKEDAVNKLNDLF